MTEPLKILNSPAGPVPVLAEDDHILLVHKPAGLAVQSRKVGQMDLESMLRSYLKGQPLYPVHRLDQPVEGLVLFARTKAAAASLSAQVQDGRMHKEYLAVTERIPEKKTDVLIHYLEKDAKTNMARIVSMEEAGKEGMPAASTKNKSGKAAGGKKEARESAAAGKRAARTQKDSGPKRAELSYEVLKTDDRSHALVKIDLKTGRFHQIRAQFQAIGCPLLGDRKYNPQGEKIPQVALCAAGLTFLHPKTGKSCHFKIEPAAEVFRSGWQEVSSQKGRSPLSAPRA